ncbi:MAG: glycine zipper domain-containing protein [Pseudomonadota bacterium]
MSRKTIMTLLVIGVTLLLDLPAVMAQQQYVFPNKGQTPEQQNKDEYDCHLWAVQQTNFDPTSAAQASTQQAQQPASAQQGSGAKGAAKGAAVGALAGSMGGEAGKGAAVGAAAGVVGGRLQSKKQQQQQQSQNQQEASAQQAAKQQDYLRARATCLEAKGYSVK